MSATNSDPFASTVVLASAGSGKTYRLSGQLLALLLTGAEPASVLATTFTRAAAGEILDRVLRRLLAGASGDASELASLTEQVGAPVSAERCAELLATLLRGARGPDVLTIDALLGRFARLSACALGIAPGWTVLDDIELGSLKEHAAEQALANLKPTEALVSLAQLSRTGAKPTPVRQTIQTIGLLGDEVVDAASDPGVWRVVQEPGVVLEPDALADAIELARQAPIPQTQAKKPDKRWSKALDAIVESVQLGNFSDLLKIRLFATWLAKEKLFYSKQFTEDFDAAVSPLFQHIRAVLLATYNDRNAAVRRLINANSVCLAKLKASRRSLAFADVPRLLAETDAELDELFFALDTRLDWLLLDEFQDTSAGQFHLLEPLIDELLSGDGANEDLGVHGRGVLAVGDVKQSLYRWRGGSSELLPNLVTRWPQLKEERLATSYRSSPVIIDAVNEVFTQVQQCGDHLKTPGVKRWDDQWEPHTTAKHELPGAVRLWRYRPDITPSVTPRDGLDADGAKAEDLLAWSIEAAAARAIDLHVRAPSATIGVLVRTNMPKAALLAKINAKARERDLGVIASAEGGSPVADAPEVAAAVAALRLAHRPSNNAALAHLVLTPVGAVLGIDPETSSSPTATSRASAQLADRFATEGIATVFAETLKKIANSMDQRGFDRWNQMLTQIAAMPASVTTDVGAVADRLERLNTAEPGATPIRVMTIHAAKGLEFDAVIAIELHKDWTRNSNTIIAERNEPSAPLSRVAIKPTKEEITLDAGLAQLVEADTDRSIVDGLCTLYVTMTRAKNVLELLVPPTATELIDLGLKTPPKGGRMAMPPVSSAELLREAFEAHSVGEAQYAGAILLDCLASRGIDPFDAIASGQRTEPTVVPTGTELDRFSLRVSDSMPPHRFAFVSPSSLHDGSTIAEALDAVAWGDEGLTWGTLVHSVAEHIEWLDTDCGSDAINRGRLAEVVRRDAVRTGQVEPDADKLAQAVDLVLRDPIAKVFDTSAARQRLESLLGYPSSNGIIEAWRERPFAQLDRQSNAVVRGRFDRVEVLRDQTGRPQAAMVIDFKSDKLSEEQGQSASTLEERTDRYAGQLDAYAKSLAGLLNLPFDRVGTLLAFVGDVVTPGVLVQP